LIGFCAEGTLGWRLLNGQTTIRIKDREEKVLAAVEKIDVFSGHGDQADLLNFVKYQQSDKLQKLFLIHGELESMEIFKEKLRNEGYPQVEIPERGQSFEL
jgi:metallo-beta-lactamase family protein